MCMPIKKTAKNEWMLRRRLVTLDVYLGTIAKEARPCPTLPF
jgi:hypothetical protein